MLQNSAGFFTPGAGGVLLNPACNAGKNWYDAALSVLLTKHGRIFQFIH